jgi:hypothetical protein
MAECDPVAAGAAVALELPCAPAPRDGERRVGARPDEVEIRGCGVTRDGDAHLPLVTSAGDGRGRG